MSKAIGDQLNFTEEKNIGLNSSFDSEASFSSTEELEMESENEEIENLQRIATSISFFLSELINENLKNNEINNSENDIFTIKSLPKLSISDYLNRIILYSNIEENTLISALIYIHIISKIKPITKYNIHKILFTSILISLKFNEDGIYKNNYYSEIAGVSTEELLILENEFLKLIKYKLFISEKTFDSYKLALVKI
jgi:hypothetical protein